MRSFHPGLTRGLALLALGFISGCHFVSDKELTNKREEIDADDDGVPGIYDCDDANPLKRPGTVEDLPENQRPQGPQTWEDPDWKDTPLDGVDNDCVDGDVVDDDGDSFPGLSRADYALAAVNAGLYGAVENVPWPQDVFEDQVDCDDTNPIIFPNAPDEEYNGIDENCQRDNDFDADGDGQMRPTEDPAAVSAYAASIGITIDVDAANAFNDCNDGDATVFGGNTPDEPYDGHDRDCDGSNDFDVDGDGYRPDGFDAQFQAFVDLYHAVDPPAWVASNQPGDCLDQAVAELAIDPALVNPGVVDDTPYDGIDQDCLGDTDYDADGDGYTAEGYEQDLIDYEAAWSVGAPPAWQPTLTSVDGDDGDCDDTDPVVAPGNLEVLGDGADSDCDGIEDATPFAYSTLAWEKPSWPRVVRNDEHYLIVTDARWAVRRTPTVVSALPDAAPNIFFAADPTDPNFPAYEATPLNIRTWANNNPMSTDPRSVGLDVVAAGSRMFVGNSYYAEATQIFKMGFVQRLYEPLLNDYSVVHLANRINAFTGYESDVEMTFHPDAGAVNPDEGWMWMTMCGGSGRATPYGEPELDGAMPAVLRQMVIRTPFTTAPTTQVVPISPDSTGGGAVELIGTTADICWHEVTETAPDTFSSEMHVCDVSSCKMYTSSVSDPGTGFEGAIDLVEAVSPYDGRGIIEADVHDDLLVLVEAAGVVLEDMTSTDTWDVFTGQPVISADAMIADGVLYVAAVVEATPYNELRLAYGDAGDFSAPTIVTLPVVDDNPEFTGGMGCDPDTLVGCEEGRIIEPRTVGLHADEQRVAISVSAWTPDGYQAAEPEYSVGGQVPAPGEQDAVGWIFMAPVPAVLPPPAP